MKRQTAAVAAADFRRRMRSRRLLIVLALVAYFGFQFTVGTFELLYQDTVDGQLVDYRGEPTAAYVGVTTGVTGAFVLLFGGYYILSGSLARARETGVDELVASTPISDRAYLLGMWLSHVGLVAVILTTLGGAAMINHAINGTGTTEPLWILGAVFLVGFPVGCAVAGVTLIFQSTVRLRATAGNILYFLGTITIISATLVPAADLDPTADVPLWLRAGDFLGLYAVGEMTIDTLLTVAPAYDGPPFVNYGTGAGEQIITYQWDGGAWPVWFLATRIGLVLSGVALVAVATTVYHRFGDTTTEENNRAAAVIARLRSIVPVRRGTPTEPHVDPATVTPVTDRSAGGFGRLLRQELRLLVRGHPWWWYAGTVLIVVVGLSGNASTELIVPIAAIWPLFLWSAIGSRTVRHQMTPFIVTSNQPYRQLFAEWMAGGVITLIFLGSALLPVLVTDPAVTVVLAGAVLFVPSIAQAMGLWSGTQRLFEILYLVCWYIGPLNGVRSIDFAGATTETVGTVIPLGFAAVGCTALTASLMYRYQQA